MKSTTLAKIRVLLEDEENDDSAHLTEEKKPGRDDWVLPTVQGRSLSK
ncbi:hypothetical protein L914_19043 [Phytophthora nicotianae]|uniref:Uncharacterized protein n=1 Tax=Phytophthora nicotianae TaxID=4792 RepID=W2MBR6_PHYNI|nr:hypothetical protein L916_19141 [Phytophthora nicotianae]ETM33745.1 hypothetical protein L914_19043 [Phytophthora nicotianae]